MPWGRFIDQGTQVAWKVPGHWTAPRGELGLEPSLEQVVILGHRELQENAGDMEVELRMLRVWESDRLTWWGAGLSLSMPNGQSCVSWRHYSHSCFLFIHSPAFTLYLFIHYPPTVVKWRMVWKKWLRRVSNFTEFRFSTTMSHYILYKWSLTKCSSLGCSLRFPEVILLPFCHKPKLVDFV